MIQQFFNQMFKGVVGGKLGSFFIFMYMYIVVNSTRQVVDTLTSSSLVEGWQEFHLHFIGFELVAFFETS
jgi:hypothetical protein